MYRQKKTQDHLDQSQLKALSSLKNNPDIVVKPADKGGNIVILNTSQYIEMCEKILKNFETVEPEVLELAHLALSDLICEANSTGIIDNNLKEFMSVSSYPSVLLIAQNS